MSKNIQSYHDLLKEKEKLHQLLLAQKELLTEDVEAIKMEIRPAATMMNFIGRIMTRNRNEVLLTAGANGLIDLVIKKVVLARFGWLTKLAVPFFLKNYSSHFIADHKDEFIEKLVSLVGLNHTNGKAAPVAPVTTD